MSYYYSIDHEKWIKEILEAHPKLTRSEIVNLIEKEMKDYLDNHFKELLNYDRPTNDFTNSIFTSVDTSTFRAGIGKGITKAVSITTQDIIKHYRMLQEEEKCQK